MLRLNEKYKKEVVKMMREKFGYKNDLAVPKIKKVVVNTGFGKIMSGKTNDEQRKFSESVLSDLTAICGQRPVLTRSKRSIAGFKVRQGLAIGAKVTLRRQKMNDFLDRFIHIVLPRSRDFRGIDQKSVDKERNLTIGMKEHIAFPEVSPERAKTIFGLEVTIVTNAKKREEAMELFKLLGFPIRK